MSLNAAVKGALAALTLFSWTPGCGDVDPDAGGPGAGGAPSLSPTAVDFGAGCAPADRTVCLRNPSDQDVTLVDLWLEQDGVGRCAVEEACDFTLPVPPLDAIGGGPLSIAPGRELCVEIRWLASGEGVAEGRLVALLDGLDGPLVTTVRAEGVAEAWRTDHFRTASRPMEDWLLVIDDSPAMEAHQERLAANLAAFVRELVFRRVDWRIGVVAMDTTTAGGRVPGLLEPQDASSAAARWVTRETYRYAVNAVEFDPIAVPGPETAITVSYREACF